MNRDMATGMTKACSLSENKVQSLGLQNVPQQWVNGRGYRTALYSLVQPRAALCSLVVLGLGVRGAENQSSVLLRNFPKYHLLED